MASVCSINLDGRDIFLNLKISQEEYEEMQGSRHILVFSMDADALKYSLTLGKLGNSYRIMLPKKILRKHDIKRVPKHADAYVFERAKEKYLVIKLEKSGIGLPTFEDGDVVEED
jgi:hypothetical protein